ncbi:MAG: hypothetical protein K0U84_12580, partial [Actinomycetia bacterium]|nr:hypothetical protein [Actinomycetes bacterium]
KAAQETARLWREKRDAETQEHRRREAEASQEAQRRALIHTAITISSVLAVLVFLGVLIFAP